eukprot:TRINITY_DN3935_c0_g1_i6.p1 TRINITY_DN3935_c0_g1~~TRINITY_DN3935_c0_g1_i6.p1  ORF type:complete len:641 (-),score=105.60 TRINITY_DN3935_c0_g1_i6:650-2572(-)
MNRHEVGEHNLLEEFRQSVRETAEWKDIAKRFHEQTKLKLKEMKVPTFSQLTDNERRRIMDEVEKVIMMEQNVSKHGEKKTLFPGFSQSYSRFYQAAAKELDKVLLKHIEENSKTVGESRSKFDMASQESMKCVVEILQKWPELSVRLSAIFLEEVTPDIRLQLWSIVLRSPEKRKEFENTLSESTFEAQSFLDLDINVRSRLVINTNYPEFAHDSEFLSTAKTILSYYHRKYKTLPEEYYHIVVPFVFSSSPSQLSFAYEMFTSFTDLGLPKFSPEAIDKASIAASIKCKDDLCSLMRVYYPEIYQHIITCLKQRPDKIHQIPVDYKEDSAENYVMMKVFSGVISTVFSTVYLLPTVVFIWDQFIVQRSFRLWPYFICCHLSLLEKEVYTCRSERELFATINQRRPEISPRVIRETFISKFHDIYLQITKEQQPSKTSFSLYYNEKEKEQQKKPASYIHQATTPVHEEDDQYSNYEGESVNFIEDDDASASQPDVSDEVIPVEVKEIQIRRKKKRFFEYIRSVRHWLKYLKAVRELTRKHKIERLERVEDDVQAISDHNIYESFWINTTFEGRRVKLCIPEIHRGIDKISDTIARVFDHPQNEKQWKVLPTEWKKTESELTQRIVDEILAKYDDIENDL